MPHASPVARLLRASVFATLLGLSAGASAQWHDQHGNPLPDDPARSGQNGFGAQVLVAEKTEADRFVHEWYNTPTEHTPTVNPVDKAARGDSVDLIILYSNCAPDDADPGALQRAEVPCQATFDVEILQPDGTLYQGARMTGLPLGGENAIAAPAGVVQLVPATIRLRIEPQDPLGEYRFNVRIRNPARDVDLALTTAITVVDTTP